jgi:putative hemolysin
MYIWNILIIFILIALNGFFVAIEFAVVVSRRSRIELLVKEGNRAAEIVKKWLENSASRDRLIAAAQLGITIVSLALGAVGENTFAALLEPVFQNIRLPEALQSLTSVFAALPLVLSLVIVTSFHVVLGEQVPKVACLNAPEGVALLGARPMQIFSTLFKWFIDALDWATQMILKIFGLGAVGSHSLVYTVDEMKEIVAESEKVGIIESPERDMLHAIFDFGELLVRHVMIPRTEIMAFEADLTLSESIKIATNSTFTKFPVYDDDLDNIIGVVHIKDLLRAQLDPEHNKCLARSLVREALFIPETVHVRSVLQMFRARRQHIAVVMDEFGGTAGLVTLEDLMEEIVGEVSDPFDATQPEIQLHPNGSATIEGLALIEEVNDALGLELDDPHYDTIAGYVMGKLGRIPEIGDEIEIDDIRLKVKSMDGMRVERLVLTRIGKQPPADETSSPAQ